MVKFIINFYLFGCLLFFQGCSYEAERIEVSRLSSPDKTVDSVLVRINFHSTTDYVYKVYIVPISRKITKNSHEIFTADHVENIDVKWLKNKELIIKYKKARIFQFTNFWQHADINNFFYIVNIEIKKGAFNPFRE